MSENRVFKQAKKRQRRSSKQQKGKQKDNTVNMATSNATSGASSGDKSSVPLPGSFPVSSFLNIPPPFQPIPNTQACDISSQMNLIISKVSKLDSIESSQANILSRLTSIETAVSENKRMIKRYPKH